MVRKHLDRWIWRAWQIKAASLSEGLLAERSARWVKLLLRWAKASCSAMLGRKIALPRRKTRTSRSCLRFWSILDPFLLLNAMLYTITTNLWRSLKLLVKNGSVACWILIFVFLLHFSMKLYDPLMEIYHLNL